MPQALFVAYTLFHKACHPYYFDSAIDPDPKMPVAENSALRTVLRELAVGMKS